MYRYAIYIPRNKINTKPLPLNTLHYLTPDLRHSITHCILV